MHIPIQKTAAHSVSSTWCFASVLRRHFRLYALAERNPHTVTHHWASQEGKEGQKEIESLQHSQSHLVGSPLVSHPLSSQWKIPAFMGIDVSVVFH